MDSKKAYKIYSYVFNIFSHFPIKDKVALLSPHMASFTDSLGEMEIEFKSRGYKSVRISGSDVKPEKINLKALCKMFLFFTIGAYRLATARFVFLNDNFMPMADLNFKKEAVITQLWHGEGALKKVGLDTFLPEDIRERVIKANERLDFLICSSEAVKPVYVSGFGVPEDKILAYGSPRADRYIKSNSDKEKAKAVREKLFGKTDKKIILYAPTFRDDPKVNSKLLGNFDFDLFNERFFDKYLLVLRLHPQMHKGIEVPRNVIDMTSHPSVDDIIKATDMLITDYSSICLNYALVGKPCIFYAFDLEEYERDRNFYLGYKNYVPGPVAETFEELIDAVLNFEYDEEAIKKFVELNFGKPDGISAKRIADRVILEANKK